MTQPSLSKHVQQLEADLGAKLFDRNTASVVLTPSGKAFLRESQQVLIHWDRAKAIAAALDGKRTETVRIQYYPGNSLWRDFVCAIKTSLDGREPLIEIKDTHIGLSSPFVDLQSGKTDILMIPVSKKVKTKNLTKTASIIQQLAVIVGIRCPYAKKGTISLDDLSRMYMRWPAVDSYNDLMQYHLDILQKIGVYPKVRKIPWLGTHDYYASLIDVEDEFFIEADRFLEISMPYSSKNKLVTLQVEGKPLVRETNFFSRADETSRAVTITLAHIAEIFPKTATHVDAACVDKKK